MALYTDDTVYSVIEKINQKYFLPDIQRPFVWKPDQIYALFDSIMRGYPINTFLFWKVSKEYLRDNNIKKFKFVLNNKEESAEDTNFNESEYFLVLDGQQRITSLSMALRGFYTERRKKKELFLNVHSGEKENDDGYLYEFEFLSTDNGEIFPDEDKLWVMVKSVYECKDVPQRVVLRKRVAQLTNKKDLIEANIDTLNSKLRSEEILNYYTEKEKDYDGVLDIFVRTNSGGTKLTYSDLLFSTIKLRWRDARDKFTDLIRDINKEVFDFDNDFILKTCFTLFSKSQKDIKYSKKNVDDETKINEIIKNWDKITESIKITRDLIAKFGIVHSKLLSSNNALIPLVYYVYKNDIQGFGDSKQKNILSKEDESLMKSFLISSLLTGLFAGASDTILYSIKEAIDANQGKEFPLTDIKARVIKNNKNLNLTEEFLNNIVYNDKSSYLVLNLIYNSINYNPSSKNNLPEQDHIFSRSELGDANVTEDNIDRIFNIRYISSIGNKRKTGTPFREWIKTISAEERKQHLIPEGEWDVDTYDKFLEERKKLMMDRINSSFRAS
jgi:uncharacterized protein with ParB-like and HNH nuclease domain